jgi:pimeloyl-ACP methyl ester carboxylesterase
MAEDVVAAMDAAGMRRATIVGISMGGMIAQHVALRHPGRVDGLVLLATTPGLPHGRLPTVSGLATLLALPLLGGAKGGRKLLARILLPKEDLPRARELMSEWPGALREEKTAPSAFLGQFAAVMFHSTGFRLRSLDVPVVVIGAEHDVLLPPVNSRRLAALIPRAQLEVLPAGHGIPITHRDVVERALERLHAVNAA